MHGREIEGHSGPGAAKHPESGPQLCKPVRNRGHRAVSSSFDNRKRVKVICGHEITLCFLVSPFCPSAWISESHSHSLADESVRPFRRPSSAIANWEYYPLSSLDSETLERKTENLWGWGKIVRGTTGPDRKFFQHLVVCAAAGGN